MTAHAAPARASRGVVIRLRNLCSGRRFTMPATFAHGGQHSIGRFVRGHFRPLASQYSKMDADDRAVACGVNG
jgi:hypothetical protein